MDSETLKLLKLFSVRDSLSLGNITAIYNCSTDKYSGPLGLLKDKGYICKVLTPDMLEGDLFDPNTLFKITFIGRADLELELKSIKRFKHGELRAWITLVIAIAAFIKGFFF